MVLYGRGARELIDTTPTFTQVIRSAITQGVADVRVGMPARVVSFDPVSQTASVKPALSDQVIQPDGSTTVVSIPILQDVPVQFPGGGGFAETFPVAKDDECWLTFADRSIDIWSQRGGEVDPQSDRRHDLNDPVAIMGVRSQPGKLTEFDTARAIWGNKGPRVAADGTVLHLGVAHNESAAQSVVRGSLFVQELGTLLTGIDTATTTAGTLLSTAGTALTSGSALNAVPIMGGALAAAPFAAAGASVISAGAALTSIKASITTFTARFADFLSQVAKIP